MHVLYLSEMVYHKKMYNIQINGFAFFNLGENILCRVKICLNRLNEHLKTTPELSLSYDSLVR